MNLQQLRPSHGRRCAATAALIAATAAIMLALSAAPSHAITQDYCGILVPAKSSCSSTSSLKIWWNNLAQYTGSGNVGVCQKMTVGFGGPNAVRTCSVNWTAGGAVNEYYAGTATVGHAGNNSDYAHTIHGQTFTDIYGQFAAGAPTSRIAALSDAEPGESVVAQRSADGDIVSLKSIGGRACLTTGDTTRASTCLPSAKVDQGTMLSATICAPDVPSDELVVYGVVPDGVTAVRLGGGAGSTIGSAAVSNNTFRLPIRKADAAAAVRLDWIGRPGTSLIQEVLPQDLTC